MPNTFAPFGLTPFGHRDGSPPTMGMSKFTMNSSNATAVFTGDLVAFSSATPGVITLYSSVNVEPPLGVFQGCEYYNAQVARQVWSPYFPGSVGNALNGVTAYVIDDPEMTYLIQASSAAVIGASNTGQMFGAITTGTGNTLNGRSAMSADATVTSLSSGILRIWDSYANSAPPGANGADNTVAAQILIVQPNGWVRNTVTVTGITS